MHNHFETIVIGGGQAGLAVGYQLSPRGIPFVIFDAQLAREHGRPQQRRGVVADQPGLYFVGLEFEYAKSSSMVQGVSRDAAYIAHRISETRRLADSPRSRVLDSIAA